MAIGYLLIQARTVHEAVPLSGVQIRILDADANTLYDLRTDENGQTPPISLETKDKSFSQNPYYNKEPYNSYSVLAQADGFNTLSVTDIPIFDGETAVLPLSLSPMLNAQRSPVTKEISIGRPAVAMNDTVEQKGTVIDPHTEPYVLRQVVIPDPISPSRNAQLLCLKRAGIIS